MEKLLNTKQLLLFLALIMCPVGLLAHDTTHVHPLISAKIAELIADTDTSIDAYTELYVLDPNPIPNVDPNIQRLYWGTDFDPAGIADAIARGEPLSNYLQDNNVKPYNRYNNVIDGVVQEDVPATKVLNHFHHAQSEKGLTLDAIPVGGPSSIRAMRLFNQSIAFMSGYETQMDYYTRGVGVNITAKQNAFFKFGQALHHVEDMSSPAHIHNDAHLTFADSEKDDYEGWYLPQQKATALGANLDQLFVNAQTIIDINNPLVDLWDYSNASSMINYYYDRSTYNATLEFPKSEVLIAVYGKVVLQDSSTPPTASGELERMFPCENEFNANLRDENVQNCLRWEEDALFEPAHWVINAVGMFQHQYSNGSDDAWWPVESEINFINFADGQNPFIQSRYYIEQLSGGNDESDPLGVSIAPIHMRASFNSNWDSVNNPAIASSDDLRAIYADNFLSPAVEYGSGFTRYWFDVANTPPYITSIEVIQNSIDVYQASWLDNVVHEVEVQDDVTRCTVGDIDCDPIGLAISVVNSRQLDIKQDAIGHINSAANLLVMLTFNEPIKSISQLLIGPVDVATHASSAVKSDGDSVWAITIPSTVLAGLNGKLQLTVKATDKNNHRRGTDCGDLPGENDAGADLDGNPATPARRNIELAMDSEGMPNRVNCYPWYRDGVSSGKPENNTAYSYDDADGDQNHWLVFDTAPPTATINVNTTLQ